MTRPSDQAVAMAVWELFDETRQHYEHSHRRQTIDALLQRARGIDATRPADADGWLPIESAPRDGNSFIVWMEDERWFATVRWVREFKGEPAEGWLFDDDIWCQELDTMHDVTGWMRPSRPLAAN